MTAKEATLVVLAGKPALPATESGASPLRDC